MIFAIVVCDDNGICTRLWVFKSTHTHTHTYTREREKFEEDFFLFKNYFSSSLNFSFSSSSNVQNEIIIIIIIILDNNYFLSKRNCLETSISIILRENQSWYTRLRWLLNGIPLIFKFTKSLVRSSENSSSKVNLLWLLFLLSLYTLVFTWYFPSLGTNVSTAWSRTLPCWAPDRRRKLINYLKRQNSRISSKMWKLPR